MKCSPGVTARDTYRPPDGVRSGARLQVLIADAAPEPCADILRDAYAPVVERSVPDATRRLVDLQPPIVITELVFADGDGVDLCRTAKPLPRPPLVIVTTAAPERVPAALIAGCNAVLLKPYAPSLLCTRIGRLRQLFDRAARMYRAVREDIAVAVHASGSATTNHVWDELECPRCGRAGATSFDFTGRRRMWCACLACEHVWVSPRRG